MPSSPGQSRAKWLYLWVDATYVKVRQAGHIMSVGGTFLLPALLRMPKTSGPTNPIISDDAAAPRPMAAE